MQITIHDIEIYLTEVKHAVQNGRYQVAMNERRPDNRTLFFDYILDEARVKEILLSLQPEDFSEKVRNRKPGFEHEWLYIFGKNVMLVERFGSGQRLVALYIKFNKLENQYVIVISFHEQQHPLYFPFKQS